jgi:hypothetical protein
MTKLPKIVRNTYNAIYHSVYGVSSWVCLGLGFRVRVFALNCVCPSVRPVSYWLEFRVMVSLSVRGIPRCHGYHSVSGLFVRKPGSLSVMGKLLGGL